MEKIFDIFEITSSCPHLFRERRLVEQNLVLFGGDRLFRPIFLVIMDNPQCWYIVQQDDYTCKIVAVEKKPSDTQSSWGPFYSQAEAIAKRVGLIRAGKCKSM